MQIIFFTFMRSCKLYYRPLQDKRKFKNLQQEMVGFNHRDNRCRKLSLTMSNSMLTSIGMSISISIGMYSHLIVFNNLQFLRSTLFMQPWDLENIYVCVCVRNSRYVQIFYFETTFISIPIFFSYAWRVKSPRCMLADVTSYTSLQTARPRVLVFLSGLSMK